MHAGHARRAAAIVQCGVDVRLPSAVAPNTSRPRPPTRRQIARSGRLAEPRGRRAQPLDRAPELRRARAATARSGDLRPLERLVERRRRRRPRCVPDARLELRGTILRGSRRVRSAAVTAPSSRDRAVAALTASRIAGAQTVRFELAQPGRGRAARRGDRGAQRLRARRRPGRATWPSRAASGRRAARDVARRARRARRPRSSPRRRGTRTPGPSRTGR